MAYSLENVCILRDQSLEKYARYGHIILLGSSKVDKEPKRNIAKGLVELHCSTELFPIFPIQVSTVCL